MSEEGKKLLSPKAGYVQHTSPNDGVLKSSVILNKTNFPALEYGKSDLASKDSELKNAFLRSG